MANVLKRLQDLEKLIRFRAPRFISILVAAEPEDQAAHDARLREIVEQVKPQQDDLVVYVRRFSPVSNGSKLPKLISIVDQI